MDTVKIFDTTLRDGEQSPGISLDVAEKLEIADQLARLGVDIIEAGFPIASDGDFESVEAIAKAVQGPIIAGAVAHRLQGRRPRVGSGAARRQAAHPRLHRDVEDPHGEEAPHDAGAGEGTKPRAAVARAEGYLDDVEFSPEDGYRSDPDFMCEVCQIAVDNGATTLNIPDTVGFAVPEDYGKLIRYVIDTREAATSSCRRTATTTSGLAVANSLAGVAERRAPGRVRDQRPGRAGRQRRARRGRDGDPHAARLLRGRRRERAHRGARPHVAARVAPHRLPRAVQQGGRRPQRVRARGRHPPARRARRPRDLRDHRRVDRRARSRADRARQALRPARVRRHAREDGHPRAGRRAERARSCASRSSPTRRSRSPKPTSKRSSPRSSAPAWCTATRSTSSSCTAAPRPGRRRASCSRTPTARSRRTAPATA